MSERQKSPQTEWVSPRYLFASSLLVTTGLALRYFANPILGDPLIIAGVVSTSLSVWRRPSDPNPTPFIVMSWIFAQGLVIFSRH